MRSLVVAVAACVTVALVPPPRRCATRPVIRPAPLASAAREDLFLCEDHVDLALAEAKEHFSAIFHKDEISRMSGDVKLAEIDGPVVKLRLSGMCVDVEKDGFWHQRRVVFGVVAEFLASRIPEIVDVEPVSEVNLEDARAMAPDLNGDRAELERLGYEPYDTVILQHRPGLTFTGFNI